jgi:hypothetical protein
MANDYETLAKNLLNTPQGATVLANFDKIREYVNKPESRQLISQLAGKGGDALKNAAAAASGGDQDTAKRLIASLLSTPEGAQLAKTVLDIMK